MQLLFVQKDDGEQGNGLAEGYQVDVDKMTVQKVGRPGCMHAWVHGAGPNCHRKFAMPSISNLRLSSGRHMAIEPHPYGSHDPCLALSSAAGTTGTRHHALDPSPYDGFLAARSATGTTSRRQSRR